MQSCCPSRNSRRKSGDCGGTGDVPVGGGAGEEIRTLDILVGNEMLYQLSYARIGSQGIRTRREATRGKLAQSLRTGIPS